MIRPVPNFSGQAYTPEIMKTKSVLSLGAGLLLGALSMHAAADDARMAWWQDAKFGMFIHWGIYAVPADGEWHMTTAHVPKDQYEKYAAQFDPEKFDAAKWVRTAKDAGMKYLVITSKHHDGFCMFKTDATDYDVVDATPWHHDPLKDLAEQCRQQGIRFCVYYSIMDWHHPDQAPAKPDPVHPEYNPTKIRPGRKDDYTQYMKTQLHELITQYHPAVLWFDGGWPDWWTATDGRALYAWLREQDPELIVNNRVTGAGDYGTPEQSIPATGLKEDWETCMTINGSWGYNAGDHNFKSTQTLLRNLIDIASKGGNYLLNVGPTAEGIIPQPEVDRLEAMGQWLKKNGAAIYGTTASPFKLQSWGRCTKKVREDGSTTLYLQVFDWPADGKLSVPVQNKVARCHLLTQSDRSFKVTSGEEGLTVHLTGPAPDPICSVVTLELAGKPNVIVIPLSQARDGSVTLNVNDAEIQSQDGQEPQVESKNGQPNIGYWLNPAATVSWTFKVTQPGKFVVSAPVAALSGSSQLSIQVGDQTIEATAPDTGDYAKFKTADFGTITLGKVGEYKLTVRPAANHWSPINLRTVTLKPVP